MILYGTRFGATQGIAQEIQKGIQENGIETEIYDLKEHPSKNLPSSLKGHDGIIIGTGIKMSFWTKSVKKYVKKHGAELKQKQDKLGFFVCCGMANKKEEIGPAIEKYIATRLDKSGLKPALIDAFGGVYDLSDTSLMSGMNKKIISGILKDEEGWENVENKTYDFRDWDQIRNFTQKFVSLIKNS